MNSFLKALWADIRAVGQEVDSLCPRRGELAELRRERDDLRRRLQTIRVANEALQTAIHPLRIK